MKKYEYIGLMLAILIIIVTYSFNHYYNTINDIINPNYVSADNYNSNVDMNTNIFNPLVVKTSKESYYRYELIDSFAN